MDDELKALIALGVAASCLIDDIKQRHPNEELRCPHMIRLEQRIKDWNKIYE